MKRILIPVILLTFLLTFPLNGFAQGERYVQFIDEAFKDASFQKFRTNLISEVKRRNVRYLLSVVDPEIRISFGSEEGMKDFQKMWNPDRSNSELWGELLKILENGGEFNEYGGKQVFWAPYTFASFPFDVDPFETQIIFGNRVNLRSRPQTSSRVLTQLSYNIIKVDYPNSVNAGNAEYPRYTWLKIETLGGQKGYVSSEYVRSHLDYRAGFEKKNGQWKITAFIAGDRDAGQTDREIFRPCGRLCSVPARLPARDLHIFARGVELAGKLHDRRHRFGHGHLDQTFSGKRQPGLRGGTEHCNAPGGRGIPQRFSPLYKHGRNRREHDAC